MGYSHLPPIVETGILALFVCVPIIVIRKLRWVSSGTSRKLLHICMASVYLLCWHLFPDDTNGMVQAMMIPLTFTVVFWVIGRGYIKMDVVTDSMSRTGVANELAAGPVHYGICISLATLFYWKRVESLYCILPLAFGDGLSAFFGPTFPGNRYLPWNPTKTWFGSAAFIFFSAASLIVYNWLFAKEGWFLNEDQNCVPHSVFVSVMCGLIETLTIPNYDNYTIFLMGILSYYYIL